ncbi:unnamed protein product [Paramecium sonneborni]|uniref:N-acetyltransferase domain-containing protein n=1 Tax=Paramecium sonneborni TaxID=65129 RepID=A0A8S1LV45_9CILI|nr:unnamed protein product [Paramecium sonneborni]
MDQDQSIKLEDIQYTNFTDYDQIPKIMPMIDAELSEPYSIYTYRYFLYGWPELSIFAYYKNEIIGAISIIKNYRQQLENQINIINQAEIEKRNIDVLKQAEFQHKNLLTKLKKKVREEIVLETEQTNHAALRLYESLGYAKMKRMQTYYMSGNDAFRLKLFLVDPLQSRQKSE